MNRKRLSVLLILCLSLPYPAAGKVLGTSGGTYLIVEPDALSEIESAAKKVDWQKIFQAGAAKVKILRPQITPLPRARANSVRTITMSYTLEEDLPNPRNPAVPLYPKGFTFNPLEFGQLPGKYVFIDGDDPSQLAFVKSLNDDYATVILTAGNHETVSGQLHKSIFNANERIVKMFELRAVPSIVTQEGTVLKVEEIYVPKITSHR